MTWLLAALLMQEPTSQADQIRAAMAASIEKQLASVRAQAQATGLAFSSSPGADSASAAKVDGAAAAPDAAQTKSFLVAIAGHLINRIAH